MGRPLRKAAEERTEAAIIVQSSAKKGHSHFPSLGRPNVGSEQQTATRFANVSVASTPSRSSVGRIDCSQLAVAKYLPLASFVTITSNAGPGATLRGMKLDDRVLKATVPVRPGLPSKFTVLTW